MEARQQGGPHAGVPAARDSSADTGGVAGALLGAGHVEAAEEVPAQRLRDPYRCCCQYRLLKHQSPSVHAVAVRRTPGMLLHGSSLALCACKG